MPAAYAESEELINGTRKGYSFRLVQLYEGNGRWFDGSVHLLYAEITKILKEIEDMQPRPIESFRIGVTYAKKKPSVTFDPMNRRTWKLKRIQQVWNDTYKGEYNGLIVLCAVPLSLGDGQPSNLYNYARDLRSRLTHVFTSIRKDERITRGVREHEITEPALKVGVVYMAFKLGSQSSMVGSGKFLIKDPLDGVLQHQEEPATESSESSDDSDTASQDPENEDIEQLGNGISNVALGNRSNADA